MPSNLNLDYYYGTEAEQYSFCRAPKALLTDRGVSIGAGCYLPQRVMHICNGEGKKLGLPPNRPNPNDNGDTYWAAALHSTQNTLSAFRSAAFGASPSI